MNEAKFKIGDHIQTGDMFDKYVLTVTDVRKSDVGIFYHLRVQGDGSTLVVFDEEVLIKYGGVVVPKIQIKEFAEDVIAATVGEHIHRYGVNNSYTLATFIIDNLRARGFRIIREATND